MIIRRRGDEYLFIAQPDHAALAGALMAEWQVLAAHPRRHAILAATRLHDNGWEEEDRMLHIGDTGEPLDFIAVPPSVKQRIWPRAADRAAAVSRYVGALVAQHALTVNSPSRDDPQWAAFFTGMTRTRDRLLADAAPDERSAIDADYPFVRTGDLLSLVFCNGWTDPVTGPHGSAILKGITLEVTPDPFDGRRIAIQVTARAVPARRYGSASELREACAHAPRLLLEGTAAGSGLQS